MGCLRGLGALCGSSLGFRFRDESRRQECTSSSSVTAVVHHSPENEDTTAPVRRCNDFVEEQTSVGDSGITLNSWASGQDGESHCSWALLASKKEHKEYLLRLEEFIADMSDDPNNFRRRVVSRLKGFLDRVHGGSDQNMPTVEVNFAPRVDPIKYASPAGSDVSTGTNSEGALSQ
eukprot:TRINITY_DN62151_c0_g1_i1.p1 TRINITY_DN62151_c0_g1~~TRINITY_DN62151_c0_g1_i1.p1  ORF type:complete len:206 (-),score=25.68 TRINITY_DN62151_c0_g1_i1:33-560(-)